LGNVNRFKPVRDHIETLINAFSARRAARAPACANTISDNRWLANISHELRTPLNVVIGLSDMLINEHTLKLDAARRSDYAQLIHASGHHLLSLSDGILDMAKLDAGTAELRREAFAPGPAIVYCAEMLAFDAKQAGLALAVELQPNLPDIVADQRAFKQILINLLSNAIKFTEQGKVEVRAAVEGRDLAIHVEDTGVGIAADDLPFVGSAFFRAGVSKPQRRDGTGLGLSIVKDLVRRQGGELELRSRAGEGTCATVRVPIKLAEVAPRTNPDQRRHGVDVVPAGVRCANGG
jgi:two-component system, cell cycle sensor histidine kinase DivJ